MIGGAFWGQRMDVAGGRCWLSIDTGDAKREAVSAIEHIEQMSEAPLRKLI